MDSFAVFATCLASLRQLESASRKQVVKALGSALDLAPPSAPEKEVAASKPSPKAGGRGGRKLKEPRARPISLSHIVLIRNTIQEVLTESTVPITIGDLTMAVQKRIQTVSPRIYPDSITRQVQRLREMKEIGSQGNPGKRKYFTLEKRPSQERKNHHDGQMSSDP